MDMVFGTEREFLRSKEGSLSFCDSELRVVLFLEPV